MGRPWFCLVCSSPWPCRPVPPARRAGRNDNSRVRGRQVVGRRVSLGVLPTRDGAFALLSGRM